MQNHINHIKMLLIPVLIFIVCLFFNAFSLIDQSTQASWELLVSGWLGFLVGWFYWAANPLFLIGLLFWLKPKVAFGLSILSLIFALAFSFQDGVIINEAGTIRKIAHLGLGYYLWCLSIVSLVLISGLRSFIYTKSDH